jgi:BirA family transcriptional regulator, biotin operon repressor / biotin---[acetyl-CoA-carboxylase] ligase
MIGSPRIHVAECESTQLLLPADAPEGAIATTDHQTAGRGRLGRRWLEPPATSLLLSVLLRPPTARRPQELSLVAATATAQAVEEATALAARIKWPNDVLLTDAKVAGILAELRAGAVVLGIGVNVNQTEGQLPLDTKVAAGSLRTATGRVHDRERLLELLLARLDAAYEAWRADGLTALQDELSARDLLRGRNVVAAGKAGVAEGIDASGRLRLASEGGTVTLVESGEVLLEP